MVAIDPMIGRKLGAYEVTGRIGAGGMGTVYRAVHQGLGMPRALKILPPHLAADTSLVERFSREARTAARLRHTNVVQIYDIGHEDGLHFIAMELVPGKNLDEIVRGEGALSFPRAIQLLRQLAAALDAAHAHGIVHRDVKPANAIVSPKEQLVLVDFGIALAEGGVSLTRAGAIGTAEYMAPELLRGERSGPSVDQYALGISLYELLTGQRPFRSTTIAGLADEVRFAPPPPIDRDDLPAGLVGVVHRAMAKRPEDRFASVTELAQEYALRVRQWSSGHWPSWKR